MRPQGSGLRFLLLLSGGVLLLGAIALYVLAHQGFAAGLLILGGVIAIAVALTVRQQSPTTIVAPPPVTTPPPPVLAPPPVAAPPVSPPPEPAVVVSPPAPLFVPAAAPLFVGREQELEDLVAKLRRQHGAGAIAVIGPAGVGKTMLISQAVERHIAEGTFKDGISWHRCADYHGEIGLRRLLLEVLDRFGGPLVAMTATLRLGEAAVADLIRGQRILFWLEDVPADFPLGRALTTLTARDERGAGPTFLIASRSDWAMPEVAEVILDPPELDEAMDQVRGWMELVGRSSDLADYDAIKAICANLSSLPLALRLAAGYAGLNGVQLPRLAADLGSAVYPPGDLARTGQQVIAYVEQALFPQPRQIFATLGAFDVPLIDLDQAIAVGVAATGATAESVQGDLESLMYLGLVDADGDEEQPALRLHTLVSEQARRSFNELAPLQSARARAARASIVAARRAARETADALIRPA